jgi:ATP-dependent protease HslVU (ClpYQ) ATPase subunit
VTGTLTTLDPTALTPRQVVAELDKYIVGQSRAKRAVAVIDAPAPARICAMKSRQRTFS